MYKENKVLWNRINDTLDAHQVCMGVFNIVLDTRQVHKGGCLMNGMLSIPMNQVCMEVF
jgi:hypothetical protein